MNYRKKNSVDTFFEYFDKYPREYFVFGFFFLFFCAIVWQTFSYTVLNYKFYEELAYNQQVWEIQLPVTRWSVYSAANASMKQGTVFSTSVDLNDLAVDPQIGGDKSKLAVFLTDILYKEMCYLSSYSDCYDDMLRFMKVLEIPEFEQSEEYVKAMILERLQTRLAKTKVDSVRIKDFLTPEQESLVLSWNITWVYPNETGLYVNPQEIIQKDLFAQYYVNTFWGNQQDIIHAVRQRDLRYIPIFQKLSLLWSDEIEKHISEERQALKQWVLSKEESIGWFIILTPRPQRIYPERNVSSQIIGFIDNAGKWHYGLEWYFNDILKWNPWEQVARKDTQWRIIDAASLQGDDKWSIEWVDIYTTIDRNIQKKVEQILEAWVKKYDANKGTIVVMEPKTGRILSLANYPSFDPNNPWEVYDLKKVNYGEYPVPEVDLLGRSVFVEDIERGEAFYYDGREIYLRKAEREEYLDYEKTKYLYKNSFGAGVYQNDAVSSLYEPGSIMKAITVAVGIDTGEIKSYSMYNDVGKLTIDNFTIANVDDECLWYHSFTHALSFSCNVGMIRIVQRVGKALLHKYFMDFWFWELTGITLQWEVFSKIDPYEKWPTSKLLTSSYGLGVSITPLQMATAYSVLANGGVYMRPYIIDRISYADGKVVEYKPEPLRRVLKESTSKTVTEMLVIWVEEWVAKNWAVEWYSIAGKTGTSQIAFRGKYEEWVGSTTASFAWYAPAEDPKFVIVVKLDRPRTNQYGWSTSAYMFSEVAEELLEYYSIPQKVQK